MIELRTGDLLTADVEALVNAVNTVGAMGKGIALRFRETFPDNFTAYAKACYRGDVRVGHMFVFDRGEIMTPRYIINFPTKDHWRTPSHIEYVRLGLTDLVAQIQQRQIRSIAVPALGCGLGGLRWVDVKPVIERALAGFDVRVLLFEPAQNARVDPTPRS